MGVDVVPNANEVFPRLVYQSGERDGFFGTLGSSSTQTSTEEGGQGAFVLAGYRRGRLAASAGAFVEFGGNLVPRVNLRHHVGHGVSIEPGYDGQFLSLTLGVERGQSRYALFRSGTGRFGLSFAHGF